MHCWNGNPYVSVDVDNVVRGAPAGEPHQPKAIDDGIGREHLYSGAVAGERAEEPHQQGTRSEIMQGHWHGPGGSSHVQADYYCRTKRRRLWYQRRETAASGWVL